MYTAELLSFIGKLVSWFVEVPLYQIHIYYIEHS